MFINRNTVFTCSATSSFASEVVVVVVSAAFTFVSIFVRSTRLSRQLCKTAVSRSSIPSATSSPRSSKFDGDNWSKKLTDGVELAGAETSRASLKYCFKLGWDPPEIQKTKKTWQKLFRTLHFVMCVT